MWRNPFPRSSSSRLSSKAKKKPWRFGSQCRDPGVQGKHTTPVHMAQRAGGAASFGISCGSSLGLFWIPTWCVTNMISSQPWATVHCFLWPPSWVKTFMAWSHILHRSLMSPLGYSSDRGNDWYSLHCLHSSLGKPARLFQILCSRSSLTKAT